MAALTANRKFRIKGSAPVAWLEVPLTAGALTIYQGMNINIASDGYYTVGTDSASDLGFGGIAWDDFTQAAGGADGDNTIRIIPKGSGAILQMIAATSLSRITGVNGLTQVYVADNGAVDLAAATTNDILVGTIFEWVAGTDIFVKI